MGNAYINQSIIMKIPEVLLSKSTFSSTGALRARDPSRPLHYEGGGFLTPATDIVCPMYARVSQVSHSDPFPHPLLLIAGYP